MNEVFRSNLSLILLPKFQQLPLWILWRLWKNLNLLVYQQRQVHWMNVVEYTRNDVKEWLDMNDYIRRPFPIQTHQSRLRYESIHSGWMRPEAGWVKCNYDGYFVNNTTPVKTW